ncbi:MAG: lytic murein transglycosylase, partial [Pseudolabrys sp.]
MTSALGVAGSIATRGHAWATQPPAFARWVANFRPRALKRGISEQTYDRVMGAVTPDTSVYAENSAQPEFTELMWQYIN